MVHFFKQGSFAEIPLDLSNEVELFLGCMKTHILVQIHNVSVEVLRQKEVMFHPGPRNHLKDYHSKFLEDLWSDF